MPAPLLLSSAASRRRRSRSRPLTCLPDALLPFPLLRLQGKRFYVQMDGRLEEAPEFAGYPSATEEVQELIGEPRAPARAAAACVAKPPSNRLMLPVRLGFNSASVGAGSAATAPPAPQHRQHPPPQHPATA